LNRRIRRSVSEDNGGATETFREDFVYDREDVLLDFVDFDGAGSQPLTLETRYLHGPEIDQVLAQDRGGGLVDWLLPDHLGTTRDIVDAAGTLQHHVVYDSFGTVISPEADLLPTRYLFTGREYDALLDLYFYRTRYYSAASGRFLSEDTIGFTAGDANLYRYVGNDPVGYVDPFGTDSESAACEPRQMTDDERRQMEERWRILRETQTEIFEIMQDVTINKAKTQDKMFNKWDEYIKL
jgi:RHS repeat-associated protein